jgi:hypothetical protein
MYLFGFGSLINLSSAQKSFKRVLTQDDLIPVKIKGYERVWNAIESIQFEDELVNGVFLNIQKNQNSILDGVVIELSGEELEILKLREKNYSCITIESKDILNRDFKSDLIAFMTTNEKKLAKVGDLNTFIPAKYVHIIKEALKNYDDDFVKGFKKSLENYPFSLKEGSYIFTDPIQNNVAREGIKK